ncbi:MAG TPA: LptA/OstA family protein [Methyloceanibacter sp.]|nr:LptA/OstA family protein [Methyloceanibacter sp.]
MMKRAATFLRLTRRALPGPASYGGPFAPSLGVAIATLLAVCSVLLAPLDRAFAQAQTGLEQIIAPPDVGSGEPMLLQADEMIYENNNARIRAKGNVEIYYGNYTLLADQVVYNRNSNTLAAEGNVRMKDPDGAVITADQLTLTDDFRDGFIDALKLVTKD